jgi:hypothetical protein
MVFISMNNVVIVSKSKLNHNQILYIDHMMNSNFFSTANVIVHIDLWTLIFHCCQLIFMIFYPQKSCGGLVSQINGLKCNWKNIMYLILKAYNDSIFKSPFWRIFKNLKLFCCIMLDVYIFFQYLVFKKRK